jgi:hypothetical protein
MRQCSRRIISITYQDVTMSLASPVLNKLKYDGLPFVEANLNYLVPMAEKPFNYTYEPPLGTPRQNGSYKEFTLPIHDARAIAQDVSLDREGFALAVHRSAVNNFYDDDEVRRVYYPEAEQLLTHITNAYKVIVFDHNVRNIERSQQGNTNAKEPVKRVHNDFTAKSGYSRARAVLTELEVDNADELLQRRFSIVNLWRPISGPVQQSPLAVCDAQTIDVSDLVASDLIYRDRVGETYGVTYNPSHQWFYFPHQQRHEALLIKCFDSATDGRARFAAHTAFDDPTSQPDAPPRESIELRTLIFYSA